MTTKRHPPHHDHTTSIPPLGLPTGNGDVYLWVPLMVVFLFTAVMIALIIVARRGAARDEAEARLRAQEEQQTSKMGLSGAALTLGFLTSNQEL